MPCEASFAMNTELFIEILGIDSTTGREGELAAFLARELPTQKCRLERFPVETMTSVCPAGCPLPENLLFSWGEPKVVFCTHMDTVPPYIYPTLDESEVRGRGTCDAKGQILAMYEACLELERRGYDGFGLLLLAGEETGSFGAKAFSACGRFDEAQSDNWVIVGEPTDNHMASAAKGTKSFEVTFEGRACHSGYPEQGLSAVEMFNDFMNALRSIGFPYDDILGETTWNVGKLSSDNPQNILSDRLSCRVYFRTTFESDEMVCNVMRNMAGPQAKLRFGRRKVQDGSDIVAKDVAAWQKAMNVKAYGGDTPMRYDVLEGFWTKPVAFGSDAPQLNCFRHRILCGPGSILVAHRPEEHVRLADLETAKANYINMYEQIACTTLNSVNDRIMMKK